MQVFVNGDPVTVEPEPLDRLLVALGYECKKVVVAVNETFVPRQTWPSHELQPEDRLDVLAAIQGG